jgi:hypothetical protein
MKYLLALLMLSGLAQASTVITLQPAGGWGALHQYHEVATSAMPDDPVTIYLPQLVNYAGGVELWFDSETGNSLYGEDNWHWTGTFVPNSVANLDRYFCSGPLIDRGGFYSQDCKPTGEHLTLQITETTRRVCNHSGRGQSCHTVWTLTGGQIIK